MARYIVDIKEVKEGSGCGKLILWTLGILFVLGLISSLGHK